MSEMGGRKFIALVLISAAVIVSRHLGVQLTKEDLDIIFWAFAVFVGGDVANTTTFTWLRAKIASTFHDGAHPPQTGDGHPEPVYQADTSQRSTQPKGLSAILDPSFRVRGG